MSFQKGDVVLAPFPFTDLTESKLRPAVVVWSSATGGNDTTICFISSQNLTGLNSTEFLIEDSDAEFAGTGLKVSSKVIVSRIVTIDRSLITRRLGKLGTNQLQQLDNCLIDTFDL
jgi:mRNA interferase MazF